MAAGMGLQLELWPGSAVVGAVLGDGNFHGVETGRGDETVRRDRAVLVAEAQAGGEVGGEAEDEAAHGSEEWVVARLLTPAVLASISESVVNISLTFMING